MNVSWSFIYSDPSVNFNAIWMIKRIDRPVACACWVCGFLLLGKQTLPTDKRVYLGKNGQMEKMRRGRTEVRDSPSVSCSILCLYSLKEYMVSVQVKYMELWTSRDEVLSRPVAFFCTNGSFSLCFVLSMVLRLDAEHIENKPNVGRRRVY